MKINRNNCCWNCFQAGHMRFQCPMRKTISCSFCRKRNILTANCPCNEYKGSIKQNSILELSILELKSVQKTNYPVHVQVPKTQSDEYISRDNIIVLINNENVDLNSDDEDGDILELHPEDDCLEDI